MGDLGVFEAMDNAGKLSAEAAANDGFELEKSVDRAIFRAKEKFGAYLANSQEFNERWAEVKPQVIQLIAGCDITPTPGVIRRVGAALRPQAPAQASAKRARPSTTAATIEKFTGHIVEATQAAEKFAEHVSAVAGALQKQAWTYDKVSHLYQSNDPMQRFACPNCGTQQDHLGFSKCAGCDRTWNSWPVRRQGTDKTSASTYVLMAREVKMRGDQYKLAGLDKAADNAQLEDETKQEDDSADVNPSHSASHGGHGGFPPKVRPSTQKKKGAFPQDGPPAQMGQPSFGTMPGDNSGATGAPVAPEAPATPAAGAAGGEGDIAGGVTNGSPIDEIQDALEGAIVALKDVQMLSVNPALMATSATRVSKIASLRTAMDRFWGLHKQMNLVAGMLAKEATEAIEAVDPRIKAEAKRAEDESLFVEGFNAAARNEPLPAARKTRGHKVWLEGYVAFHKQADLPNSNFVPTGNDETAAGNRGEGSNGFLNGVDGMQPANEIRGDAGTFDKDQPAAKDFVKWMDDDNTTGTEHLTDQGESSTIQPKNGARRPLPKSRG